MRVNSAKSSKESVSYNADSHPQEISSIVALLTKGRYEEAAPLAHAMVMRFPQHGISWTVLGTVLIQMGQIAEALPHMQKAVELSQNNPDVHSDLGNTLLNLGRMDEAEASYRRAVEINPGYSEAHNSLGNLLRDIGRLDEAVASYRRAIEINPCFADAHSNLGSVLMTLGKMGDAEKALNKAIELAPGEARPLSTALLYIPYQQNDPRFDQLEAAYSRRHSLPIHELIWLNFSMAKAMENIGQYDRSFIAYEEGNRLYYQTHPFDEARDKLFLENSCSFFYN